MDMSGKRHGPTTSHPDDQRRLGRIEVDLPARYRSTAVSLDGRVRDLSPDGVRFVSSRYEHPRDQRAQRDQCDEIDLELDLPDDETHEPLRLHGEVRWLGDGQHDGRPGMGIRFVGLSVEERRRLANFVILRTYRRP
jgi:hypothetical protein